MTNIQEASGPVGAPLPTVIGPTENALRALLLKVLATTAIADYASWVTLNATSNADPAAPSGHWRRVVADALKVNPTAVDEVLAELAAAGLVTTYGSMTERGAVELAAARAEVRATTSALVAGIGESEQETTRQVLAHIRGEAEALLGWSAQGGLSAERR